MSFTIAKGSLFPCQQSGCEYKLRLYQDLYLDNLEDFKCARCMDLKGYTFCSECHGICKTDTIYCFICEKEYSYTYFQKLVYLKT